MEKAGCALGSAEKAGATKEIQSAEEGGSSARFSKSFSRSFLEKKIFRHVLGVLWCLKTYSEEKIFMGHDF